MTGNKVVLLSAVIPIVVLVILFVLYSPWFEGNNLAYVISHIGQKKVGTVLWYGARGPDQTKSGAFGRLQTMGFDPVYRSRPVSNLEGAKLVIIDWGEPYKPYDLSELTELKNFVGSGGRLILAMDNDYYYCNPPTSCAMEMSKNFGFEFRGDISGTVVHAAGYQTHPIWTEPHHLTYSSGLENDGYVDQIIDPVNVKVLGTVQGKVTSSAPGDAPVNSAKVIVVNEDPSFKGGKVMGIGRNLFAPTDRNFNFFDNVVAYMTGPAS